MDPEITMNKNAKRNIGRWILMALGTLFVGLGIVGIFVPILPTTPFMLLAAACYARSSQRLRQWLLTNRWFGRYIKNYLEGKGLPWREKVGALVLLWATVAYTGLVVIGVLLVKALLAIIALGVTIHLLRIPTSRQ